jgi:hypothetical protein
MPVYVAYDKADGTVLHVHSEYLMDSDVPIELSEKEILNVIKGTLPKKADVGLLASDEDLCAKRGYRYHVDLSSDKLMLTKNPPRKRGKK